SARAATRLGCRTMTRPASTRAGGTLVVLPAPGAATSTAARRRARASRTWSRWASIGRGESVTCGREACRCGTIPVGELAMSRETLQHGDALLIVDMQNDFVSGSLAVPDGAEVVEPLNR